MTIFQESPPILQAFLSGDAALRVAQQNLEITKEQIAEVMRNIYGDRASDPVDIIMHDFITNPYFLGNFGSATPGTLRDTFEDLNHPIGRLHLAGEAYIYALQRRATGAIVHGYRVGERVAELIGGPLRGMHAYNIIALSIYQINTMYDILAMYMSLWPALYIIHNMQ